MLGPVSGPKGAHGGTPSPVQVRCLQGSARQVLRETSVAQTVLVGLLGWLIWPPLANLAPDVFWSIGGRMPANHARNVALTPELDGFIDELVASGDYANASEVLRAGLRAVKERREIALIGSRIGVALEQLDRGEGVTGDPRKVLGSVLEAARTGDAS